ncbi:glycosyl hydrolase family 28-related protein [Williamsia sterculiae]|uniref:Pectate lyase superfamily protein n=1 Tax=Williamsia sterculiae TaxID=1344003 RepID=A0A1N7CHJ6_9NOCA|nr:glycosyl hydrolase family 28-related protein [Williamsia sterculiae]SIR63052.1 Pectate lyase superfamily protein [Williamsia sterculiae]
MARKQLGTAPTRAADALTVAALATKWAVVNVKDYGATGDGTTDDSAAITAATSALTNGQTLYFPAGNYRFAQKNPASGAAVAVVGKSNIAIMFDPAARLTMDNLDSSGNGTGHGILVKGAATNVTLVNPNITWTTVPSARSFGDGVHVLGYPSDSAPPAGWVGSTGTVTNLTVINGRVANAPQTGMVLLGVSDPKIIGFRAISTLADGLHFNACRRITAMGHTALSCGDDGLAFVTYYDASALWATSDDGPFQTSVLTDWCNSGAVAAVAVTGGSANGVRIQQARDLAVSSVTVNGKSSGIIINSSIAGGSIAWTSLASRNVTINSIAIASCDTGITIRTEQINSTNDSKWWDFAGVNVADADVRGCTNWSVSCSGDGSVNSTVAGIRLGSMKLVAGSGGGGQGGVNITSLRSAAIDGVHLVTDHGSQFLIGGADTLRSGSVTALPSSQLSIGRVVNEGGNLLIQDIAGITAVTVESRNAPGDGVQLNRVKDAVIQNLRSTLPGRSGGLTRGLLLTKTFNIDIANAVVAMDAATPSSFSSIEIGGGDAGDIAANGLRIEKLTYTSALNDTANKAVSQGGSYGPLAWYARLNWRHSGASTPVWFRGQLGDQATVVPLLRQTLNSGSTVYQGLAIPMGALLVGAKFRVTLDFANPATAATQAIALRWGPNGSAGDTPVLSFTATGTAAADKARLVFDVGVDSISTTTGAVTAQLQMTRQLQSGTTGFHNVTAATSQFSDAQATSLNTFAATYLGVSIVTSVASTTILLSGVIERIY